VVVALVLVQRAAHHLVGQATTTTTTDPVAAKLIDVARIGAYVVGGYFALIFLGLGVLLVLCAVVVLVMRLNGPDSPFSRRIAARLVARSSTGDVHRADDHGDVRAIADGLAAIRQRDPLFDEQVVIQTARRAQFFMFAAGLDGDERRLAQIATDGFWGSPAGTILREEVKTRQKRMAALGGLSGIPLLPMPLDYDAPEAEVQAVQADRDGVDRVTVRLAYRAESAVAGPGAAEMADVMAGRFSLSKARATQAERARQAGGATAVGDPNAPLPVTSARIGHQGWYDFVFVRPTSARTATGDGTGGRQCHECGAPYRSDLDVACPHCQSTRRSSAGAWKLDGSWYVVDTEARAGQGLNREAHDAAWAARRAGRIALKVGESFLE
jgi:hypothetical protein